jgi:hypothetical protein
MYIYLYNETNRSTNFQIYSGKKLYMFRAVSLPITRTTPDDGQRNGPEHVEFLTRINLEISVSVGFIVKKFVTKHGHMNVKCIYVIAALTYSPQILVLLLTTSSVEFSFS